MGSSQIMESQITGHQGASRVDEGSDGSARRRRAASRSEVVTTSHPVKQPSSTPGGEPASSVTGAGSYRLVLRTDYRQRWKEWAFLAIYLRDAIVGPFYDPILPPQPGGSKRPVVLVPGWCGRTRSFQRMADRFHQAGHPVYPVPLGSQLGCIDRKAGLLSAYLDQHKLSDVYVVAHSMGGLITVRSMMKGESRIHKAITLGTPYRGTYLIYPGYCLSIFIAYLLWHSVTPAMALFYFYLFVQIPSLWQMMPRSPFLTETLTYLGSQAADKVQCVYAICDQVVIHNWKRVWAPTRLHRHNDVCIPEWGHMNLFMGETAAEEVLRLIGEHEERNRLALAAAAAAAVTAAIDSEMQHQPVLVCKCCGN